MAKTERCFKHICAARAIISCLSFSVVLSCRLSPTQFPPLSPISPILCILSLDPFSLLFYHYLCLFLSSSFSVYLHFTPFAHTFIPNWRTLTVPNPNRPDALCSRLQIWPIRRTLRLPDQNWRTFHGRQCWRLSAVRVLSLSLSLSSLFEDRYVLSQRPPSVHHRVMFATPSRRPGINIKCGVCETPTLIGKRG